MTDLLIIGGGPAGLSAAMTALRRNKSCLILTGERGESAIAPSRAVENYPGLPHISGAELLEKMERQAVEAGAELRRGKVTAILPMGNTFSVAAGQEIFEGRTLLLCTGIARGGAYPGERELLGRGVSYCVTCDGMLYRGKDVCVIGLTEESAAEAKLLEDMGCCVRLFTKKDKYEILGEKAVTALRCREGEFPCSAVFILRPAAIPDALLSGLAMDGEHIAVNRRMECSLPGVFAAGDCTGEPYQIAKAVGEGNVAALSACAYLEKKEQTA